MTREELNQEKQQEIFSEERHEKRKKITIFVFKLCFFIVVGFIVFYAIIQKCSKIHKLPLVV